MGVAYICRGGVSQSNNGGYNLWGGRRWHTHSLEDAYSIIQNYQRIR
jgi:hypothetical protein